MSISINRRTFGLGTAGLAISALVPSRAFAQTEMRTVTTSRGTYDIPTNPQRVVAIDSRLDLQPALALGLPVIGYGHSVPGPWVPMTDGLEFYGSETNIEQVLASEPDLILCADYDGDSPWWPSNRLETIAPVVPVSGGKTWKEALRELATTLDMEGAGEEAIAEYDGLIADIRARHGDKIAAKKVVSVQPGTGVIWAMNGSTMLQTQVLADLGATTVPPQDGQLYDSGEIGAEAFLEILGDVDGILLATTDPEQVAGVADNPLWQRLPAVENEALVAANGNINYGSIYSAIQVARYFGEVYGKIA